MTTMAAPMCYSCRHLIDDPSDYPKCAAFPDGIPPAIFYWEADHRVTLPGDNGIVFEQDVTKAPLNTDLVDAVFKTGG